MAARDYLALARGYETGVRAGEISACKWVRLACERNARDLERQRTDAFPFWFDEASAVAICAAAEQFPHIKGPKAKVIGFDDEGRPLWQCIELEPWQCWILTTLFGWLCVGSYLRRFRTGLILVPRKNAKSTIAAVILLFMLTLDGEMGAECYSAATSEAQARIVAQTAWVMAKRVPAFCEYFGVVPGSKTAVSLSVEATASEARALAATDDKLDGLNVHFACLDEVHAHKTRGMWDVIETATGARDQSLVLGITTAGSDTGGICYEQLIYLRKLLEGALEDETYFGIEYTIDEGDDPFDPATHRKANPNYGISVNPDDLARKAKKARHSPSSLNNFLTKHLNVWVKGDTSWMPMEAWHRCGNAALKIEDFKDVPCWIGVDLAETRDIAALIALFQPAPGRYVAFGKFFLPEDTVGSSPVAQYSGWEHEGYLIATDGSAADYERIELQIIDWCETYLVQAVCFDRALASQMQQSLMAKLGKRPEVITVEQNVQTMSPAMKECERLVLTKHFTHTSDPVYTWMMSNVVVQKNYKDEIYPRKAGGKDSPNKIDGPVATFTVLSVAMKADPPRAKRTRGIASVWTPEGFQSTAPHDQPTSE